MRKLAGVLGCLVIATGCMAEEANPPSTDDVTEEAPAPPRDDLTPYVSGNKLLIGQRLLPGQCLVDNGYWGNVARLCMTNYARFTLSLNGRICFEGGATGHTASPQAYMIMQSDGNLVIYQYPGGPARWGSNTLVFKGGHLEVYANYWRAAQMAITDSATFQWTIGSCF